MMYNFHSHTNFCDGSAEAEAYVEEAIRQGFKIYGFSSHAPIPVPNDFALTEETFPLYREEVERLKTKYKERLMILAGVEADFIPGMTTPFERFREDFRLDYVIGSVHMVKAENGAVWFIDGPLRESYDDGLRDFFGNDIRLAVVSYYNQINRMIEAERFEVVGHLDKITMHNQNRFFTTDEKWYQNAILETIALLKEKDIVVEVNTRGLYKKRSADFFPEQKYLRHIFERKIPVMINSDAHAPKDISLLRDEAAETLRLIGFREQAIITDKGMEMIEL